MSESDQSQEKSMQRAFLLVMAVACLPAVILLGLLAARFLGSAKPQEYLVSLGLVVAVVMLISERWVFRMRFWTYLPAFIRNEKDQAWIALIIAGMCSLNGIDEGMTFGQMAWEWVTRFAVILPVFAAVMFCLDLAKRYWRGWRAKPGN